MLKTFFTMTTLLGLAGILACGGAGNNGGNTTEEPAVEQKQPASPPLIDYEIAERTEKLPHWKRFKVIVPFVGDSIPSEEQLKAICRKLVETGPRTNQTAVDFFLARDDLKPESNFAMAEHKTETKVSIWRRPIPLHLLRVKKFGLTLEQRKQLCLDSQEVREYRAFTEEMIHKEYHKRIVRKETLINAINEWEKSKENELLSKYGVSPDELLKIRVESSENWYNYPHASNSPSEDEKSQFARKFIQEAEKELQARRQQKPVPPVASPPPSPPTKPPVLTKQQRLIREAKIRRYVGKWTIKDAQGRVATYFTIAPNFTAKKSHAPDVVGKWELVGNEIRITWGDGWKDILRPSGRKVLKLAFTPGKDWGTPPHNIQHATKN
mgnify:CR=1 FL=1